MSIEKKSLISTLKTTKKANIAAAPVDSGTRKETMESTRAFKAKGLVSAKNMNLRSQNLKSLRAATMKSAKTVTSKKA